MTTSLKVRCAAALAAYALTILSVGACNSGSQGPQGATIVIQGPANDVVQFSALQNPSPPACSCLPVELGGACVDLGAVTLGSGTGQVSSGAINMVVDDSAIETISTAGPTPCMGVPVTIPQCPSPVNPFTVPCTPTNTAGAQGQIKVTGSEHYFCRSREGNHAGKCNGSDGVTVCETGTVSVTFDGQTASATYDCNSTSFALAFGLAQAIVQNATLGSQFVSAANGPVTYVNAINTGTQYDYSWTSSVSCGPSWLVSEFGSCAFSAGLSPAASLASPPLQY